MTLRHVAALVLLAPVFALAAPEDFRVFTDEISERGEFGLEFQAAVARSRTRTEGSRSQALAEFSYGLTDTVEVALQLPASRDSGDGWRGNGANLELQYAAPHDSTKGAYWGLRAEIGRGRGAGEAATASAIELRPIVGYRVGDWHAVFNATVRAPVSGNERETKWEPSAKLAYSLAARTAVGIEYYVEAGESNGGAVDARRRALALLAVDTKVHGIGLNVGVGRGVGSAGDGTVLKAIVAFDLD